MKIITDALPAVRAICPPQKIKENTAYRMTKLCVTTDCADGRLLFHTLTGMLVLLEDEADAEASRDELIKEMFYVPEDFDELAYADKVISIAKALKNGSGQKKKLSYTVLTTTDCNARCYYCYEAGISCCYMSADVAKDVSDYITGASDGREVELRWFGGEPLMNPEVIDIICGKLREAGVEYTSAMVSNGYLFNGDVIGKAKGLWNLKSVQITLDGCGEVYNRVKAYKEPGDAYSRVINNVDNALKAGIKVHIHLNVSRKNISDLMTLADELEKTFSKREGLFASAALLGDFRRENGRFNGDVYDAQEYLKLRKKLKDAGFEGKRVPLKRELNFNNCMADNDGCEIILPDGRLSKCDEQLDKDCFGDIYSKERDTENIKSWKEQVKLPECYGCPLYARCINLKKCVWVNENCSKTSQIIRLSVLKDQITDAYKEWKETLK